MLWEQATYYSCTGKTGITSKIGGGFAHVEPLDYELEQLENIHGERPFYNYEEFSDALAEMQYRSFDCVNLDPDKVETDGPLEVIHELDHEDEEEDQLYFYHPDHLGSSSFITDANGEPYQFLQYLPFGESFISQRLDEWKARYTFSAKEKDEATGYHYFGARYYDSETSVWLSVDPMATLFPGISPYSYCIQNPVNYVDPDGNVVLAWDKSSQELVLQTLKYTFGENHGFSFDGNMLVHNGEMPEGMTSKQELMFDYFMEVLVNSYSRTIVHNNTNAMGASKRYFQLTPFKTSNIVAQGDGRTWPIIKKQGRMAPTLYNHILITKELNEEGTRLATTDEVKEFSTEHALLHEFGHAMTNTIEVEMGGTYKEDDFNKMSKQAVKDWAIRLTNTLLFSQGRDLETGRGQHGRTPDQIPSQPPQPIEK